MSAITTHVLDLSLGRPAAGVEVRLERETPGKGWVELAQRATEANGRVKDLLGTNKLETGRYRLIFDTGAYFADRGSRTFYPEVPVVFEIADAGQHHHVPLLVSPFGYSTYRGS